MGYNQENYKRIREEYRTKYLRAYEEANRRMAEVHAKSPEIAAIDRELSMAGAEIALAVIGTGEGYKEKLAAAEQKNLALQEKRGVLLQKLVLHWLFSIFLPRSSKRRGKSAIVGISPSPIITALSLKKTITLAIPSKRNPTFSKRWWTLAVARVCLWATITSTLCPLPIKAYA